jgi:L-ascorbate metabolism protein UlaG (beta-lactamase superfamily)
MISSSRIATTDTKASQGKEKQQVIVRINGVLPHITKIGAPELSERAAQVVNTGKSANTSCSIFVKGFDRGSRMTYHLLFDIGQGIITSVEAGISELGLEDSLSMTTLESKSYPSSSAASGAPLLAPHQNTQKALLTTAQPNFDALLITHSHEDHVRELANLVKKLSQTKTVQKINIYCTLECQDQLRTKLPLSSNEFNFLNFSVVKPNEYFSIGPILIMPVSSYHGQDSPAGSVIYIINIFEKKIIVGWDFLSLPDVNETVLWNPDLAILGTETYNEHPETGMISVTEAYNIVRRWNAKECYILHYSGLKDFEEAKNQWFRGPVKALTLDELQRTIDSHLRLSGAEGKFRITVAKEGMIWTPKEEEIGQGYDKIVPIGRILEIESLDRYVLKIKKDESYEKMMLVIEDRINRYNLIFDKPYKDRNNEGILHAQGERGTFSKGPELIMELSISTPSVPTLKIDVFKGRKTVFKDDVLINESDARRFKQYIQENFT